MKFVSVFVSVFVLTKPNRKRIERLLIGGDDRSGTPPLSLLSNQRSNSGNGSRGSKTSSPQRATTPANGFPPGESDPLCPPLRCFFRYS